MELTKIRFTIGQMVYGKLRGYPPWPGVITEIDEEKAKVVYFNWNSQFSYLHFNKLTPYHAGRRIVNVHYGRNKKFTKAYDEMEYVVQLKSEQQKKRREEKSSPKKPMIILQRLSGIDIKNIKRELKQESAKRKSFKLERKLRSGRKF